MYDCQTEKVNNDPNYILLHNVSKGIYGEPWLKYFPLLPLSAIQFLIEMQNISSGY